LVRRGCRCCTARWLLGVHLTKAIIAPSKGRHPGSRNNGAGHCEADSDANSGSTASGSATPKGHELVGHLGGRRDACVSSGTGSLPSRPKLTRPIEVLAGTAWLPAGGSPGRNAPDASPNERLPLTNGRYAALLAELASQRNPALGIWLW